MSGDVETTITTMRDAARAMRSVTTSTGDEIRALAAASNAIDAAMCERLAAMNDAKEHETDGASSISTWARRELNQDAGLTRQMVRAAGTFRDLPAVGEAARSGVISFEHVASFTFALKHIGIDETRMIEQPLLDVAKHVAPKEFWAKVRQVRVVTMGRAKPDGRTAAKPRPSATKERVPASTGEGWHVTGFLDVETGAKLTTILKNLSVPRDADDERRPSERRMDALDQICTKILENGLPSDNGIRPHIFVTVEAETLKALANQHASRALNLDLKPATLEGFGSIGPGLLKHLMCGAEITPFLIKTIGRNTEVLDVGRTERLATLRQAKAISLRQHGVCAAPAATMGRAKPDGRAAAKPRSSATKERVPANSLVHTNRLQITGTYSTGFVFTTARGSPRHVRAA